jgi:ribosomal protein L40E
MTTEFRKQILLAGPIKGVFELCISYFRKLGYELTGSEEPSWARFKKRINRLNFTKDDIGRTHFLTLQLDSITQSTTNAVFHFQTEWVIGKGNWNTRSVQEAESLLDHLRIVCNQKFEKPKAKDVQSSQTVEKEKLVEREVVVKVKCRYCGALNDQMARKCVSCGGPM